MQRPTPESQEVYLSVRQELSQERTAQTKFGMYLLRFSLAVALLAAFLNILRDSEHDQPRRNGRDPGAIRLVPVPGQAGRAAGGQAADPARLRTGAGMRKRRAGIARHRDNLRIHSFY